MPQEFCPDCQTHHDVPFTNDTLELVDTILKLPPGKERAQLMMDLADIFTDTLDDTNIGLPEDLHILAEEYKKTSTAAGAAAARLSRVLLHAVTIYNSHHSTGSNEDPPTSEHKPNTSKTKGLN
jgi:hypothetical protein